MTYVAFSAARCARPESSSRISASTRIESAPRDSWWLLPAQRNAAGHPDTREAGGSSARRAVADSRATDPAAADHEVGLLEPRTRMTPPICGCGAIVELAAPSECQNGWLSIASTEPSRSGLGPHVCGHSRRTSAVTPSPRPGCLRDLLHQCYPVDPTSMTAARLSSTPRGTPVPRRAPPRPRPPSPPLGEMSAHPCAASPSTITRPRYHGRQPHLRDRL